MASRQHQSARPGAVPHPARRASAHRRRLVRSTRPTTIAHGQSDAIEGVTHSLCTLEFEDHRPLYDWLIDNLPVPSRPRQYEFARLNLDLHGALQAAADPADRRGPRARLGRSAHADPARAAPARRAAGGDPRLRAPDRRRQGRQSGRAGAPGSLRARASEPDRAAPHGGAATRSRSCSRTIRKAQTETLEAINNPEEPPPAGAGAVRARAVHRARRFPGGPAAKFFRLAPGREVRLRYAYFITCREAIKNAAGEVVELRCTYDPATRGGDPPDGRKVKGTLHWVSAAHAVPAEVRLYDHLFTAPEPGAGGDVRDDLNPRSLGESRPVPARARAGRGSAGRARAVRAPGLLRAGPGFTARPAGVQPHGRTARQLGQGSGQGPVSALRTGSRRPGRRSRRSFPAAASATATPEPPPGPELRLSP